MPAEYNRMKRFRMRQILRTPGGYLMISLLLLAGSHAGYALDTWIWDNNGTTGKSGVERQLFDPGNSTYKDGLKEDYHTWPLPIKRDFEDFDPEEDHEATERSQTAYVTVSIPRNWHYRGQLMAKGIYHVKLGAFNAGSLKTHLRWEPLPPTARTKTLRQRLSGAVTEPDELTLVLKQEGKVKAVLPVTDIQPLTKAQKQYPSGRGWVTYNPFDNPVGILSIRGKRFTYQTWLTP